MLDHSGTVIINRLLDGQSPLSLDKYYLEQDKKSNKSATTNGNVIMTTSNNVPASPTNNNNNNSHTVDLNYVMPLGRVISINLVSWVSPAEFYVQLKDQQTSFSEFIKSVQVVPRTAIRQRVPAGTLVLTTYATTGLQYRAEVGDYNETLHKYKVFFVDIGVRAIVSADQVYENPFLLTKVPKFSHKCCLVDRETVKGDRKDPLEVERIGAILKGALEMQCCVQERLNDGTLNVVQVRIDGKDLLETINASRVKEEVAETPTKAEFLVNNDGVDASMHNGRGQAKQNPEMMLRNQKLWIRPVDFLSKEIFRFSIKDVKGGDLYKGAYEKGAGVHLGTYTAVEVTRIENQM